MLQATRVRCQIDPLLSIGVLPADGRLRQQAGADGPTGRSDDAAPLGGGRPALGQGDIGPLASCGFLIPVDVRRQDRDAMGVAADLKRSRYAGMSNQIMTRAVRHPTGDGSESLCTLLIVDRFAYVCMINIV